MSARNRRRNIKVVWYTCKICKDKRPSGKLKGWLAIHSPDTGTVCKKCNASNYKSIYGDEIPC